MEIDITDFVTNCDPFEFSASTAELGANAGPITWKNAKAQAVKLPLLTTAEQLDALRAWANDSGAWDDDEIAAWSPEECTAMFIQLVSGDMREMGLDECDLEDFDWDAWRERSDGGGNIYQCDIESDKDFGRIFYYLGC
jgi:hypothetical protein